MPNLPPSPNSPLLADGLPDPAGFHCRDCLEKLIKMTTALAAGGDEALVAETLGAARRVLGGLDLGARNTCEASGILQAAIRRQTGSVDPFKEYKQREIEAARDYLLGIAPESLSEPEFCLKMTALGNSLDFFKDSAKALADSAPALGREDFFFHNDLPKLFAKLEKGPELLVFLADNAGEFLLDLPFLTQLKKKAQRVIAVVKGGPCGNDLTRKDLALVLDDDNSIEIADTGVAQPGVPGAEAAPGLYSLLNRADLVIAKGMANFETLYGSRLESPVLFIFQVKCPPVQAMLDSPQGAFWALWQGAESRNISTRKGATHELDAGSDGV